MFRHQLVFFDLLCLSCRWWLAKTPLGSTIGISDKGMGKVRNYTVSGYKYTEVYSRLYYEATFGIRWAGIVLNSDTVEVYVGSTVNGSLYGGAVIP